MDEELRWVSMGFNARVMKCEKYDVNGYRFHTEEHQNSRPDPKTINTGVYTPGQNELEYYGRVGKIYELTFDLGREDLRLAVFKCRWFDPYEGLRHTPSLGLVEVRPSTVYAGADLFIAATQATQVYYLPYPCQKEYLKGWEVVFKVAPHGKLPDPNDDDYYYINPMTYEGVFYQEQPDDVDVVRYNVAAPLGVVDVDPNDNDAWNDGEAIVNDQDILMLEKLNEDVEDEEEPPPTSDNEDDMRDSDDETGRGTGYNSDDSYGF
jgi:hypothetical protein